MRRLPVYLLLDVSGSMNGEPIEAIKIGVQTMVTALRQDPYALETASLSIVTFSDMPRVVVPLTELAQLQIPQITCGGQTAMGAALVELAQLIETEVKTSTPTQKGDWKPLVFFLTDGDPTDDLQPGIDAIRRVKIGTFVACAAGPSAKTDTLSRITNTVVKLDTLDSAGVKAFFKWVSASVSTGSQRVEAGKEVHGLDELPPPPPELKVTI